MQPMNVMPLCTPGCTLTECLAELPNKPQRHQLQPPRPGSANHCLGLSYCGPAGLSHGTDPQLALSSTALEQTFEHLDIGGPQLRATYYGFQFLAWSLGP